MAITYIDTAAKEIIPEGKKSSKFHPRLFLKTFFLTVAVTFGIFIVIGLISAFIFYPKFKSLQSQFDKTYSQAKILETSLKDRDIKKAETDLISLESQLKKTRSEYKKLSLFGYIPVIASYYNDGNHLLNTADIGINLGKKGLVAIDPFGDVLGFKGTKVELTAEKKAEVIIKKIVPKLIPLVDDISEDVLKAKTEINKIDQSRYPKSLTIKGVNIFQTLDTSKKLLNKASEIVPQVKPLLQAAPEVAGEPIGKNYLILLQNDKELRPTGGFITSYALAKVKGGRLIDVESDDIYQLDKKYRRTEESPDAVKKYLGWSLLPIRDSNISPDFKISAMQFESMYNTIPKMPKISGVFALDTEFVRALLEVTGPIKTKKTRETFSAKNNRLGIPDVVYKLELHAEKINRGKRERKGILGELMDALIDKVSNAKTDEMPKFISVFLKEIKEKHILFYFHNEVFQDFSEKYNASGRIKDYGKDYFHLNNSNFGGLKGNLYIKTKVEQNITIEDDGTVTKKVKVTLTNPVKADGWLSSIYLNWMRLYVPFGSSLIDKKVYKDFTSGVEFDKEVYRGFGPTYPLNSSTAIFTYKLPFKVKQGKPYKMLIQKQPGVEEVQMIIKINGQEKENFKLRTDTELSINF